MKKIIVICCIVVIGFTGLLFGLSFAKNPMLDRFNPLVFKEESYARVAKGTQDYKNVSVYSEDGKKLGYTLTFNGYDPSKEFVKVLHKGLYVKSIEYLDNTTDVSQFLTEQ